MIDRVAYQSAMIAAGDCSQPPKDTDTTTNFFVEKGRC
jgi:hypothetical protein